MKRTIVIAGMLALSALVAVSVASAAVRKWNEDVNNSGSVNIVDVLQTARVAFGLAEPTLATDTRQMSETFIIRDVDPLGSPPPTPQKVADHILLDSADYASGSLPQLEVAYWELGNIRQCFSLVDGTGERVAGSLVCAPIDACPSGCPAFDGVLRSDPLILPAGEHLYTLQVYTADSPGGGGGQWLVWARVVVYPSPKPSTPPRG
jgi:hypothetical protein